MQPAAVIGSLRQRSPTHIVNKHTCDMESVVWMAHTHTSISLWPFDGRDCNATRRTSTGKESAVLNYWEERVERGLAINK